MTTSAAYVAISIAVLAIIAVLVFRARKGERENRLTPLASLAFGFVLAGIIFGENRLVGYSLMGIGVILAVVDIFVRSRKAA
jgi:O-antigen ligase